MDTNDNHAFPPQDLDLSRFTLVSQIQSSTDNLNLQEIEEQIVAVDSYLAKIGTSGEPSEKQKVQIIQEYKTNCPQLTSKTKTLTYKSFMRIS